MAHNDIEQLLLDASKQNVDKFSPFVLLISVLTKGCHSKYPVNIACMQLIRKYLMRKSSIEIAQCLDNQIVPEIIAVLKQNNDHLNLLCCGYVRQCVLPKYIPTDVIDMLTTRFCTVQCITDLQEEGLSVITSIMQRPNQALKRHLQDWCDRGLNDILIQSSEKGAPSLRTRSNIIIALHSIHLCSPTNVMIKKSLLKCLSTFSTILRADNPPSIESILDNDDPNDSLISRLMSCVQEDSSPDLQHESLSLMVNMTCENASYFAKHVSLNSFVPLLKSHWYQIQENTVWILGNIASEFNRSEFTDPSLISSFYNQETLDSFVLICSSAFDEERVAVHLDVESDLEVESVDVESGLDRPRFVFMSLLKITSWTLVNFCRCLPSTLQNMYDLIKCLGCLLKRVLQRTYDECTSIRNEFITNVGWCFVYLIEQDEFKERVVDRMFAHGIVEQLIALIVIDQSENVLLCMIRVMAMVSTCADRHATQCLRLGILNKYHKILSDLPTEKETIEICFTLANFATGPLNHTLQLLDSKLFPILFELLKTGSYKVRREVLWVVRNSMCPRNANVMNTFIEFHMVDAIIAFLRCCDYDDHDRNELDIAVECIAKVLVFAKERLSDDFANILCVKWKENGVVVNYVEALQCAADGDDSLDVSDVIKQLKRHCNVLPL
eukprot:48670_1